MARQILPIIGAAVGSYLGGPTGAQIGWMVGSYLGNVVDPQVQKAPNIGDLAQQTSQEGVARPFVFGTSPPMAGNLIACSQPKVVKRRQRQGKGGPVVETNYVYRTYAIGVCEGQAGFLRIWRNGTLVYDVRPGTTGMDAQNTEFLKHARLYDGSFTQLPSPDLEAFLGVGDTPAFRGTCYLVMANEDLTDTGGAVPTWAFQVNTCWASPRKPALVGGGFSGSSGPAYTADGLTWNQAIAIRHAPSWMDYYGGFFLSAQQQNDLNGWYRSTDAINWSRITPPAPSLFCVAFNGDGLAAIGGGTGGEDSAPFYYSEDFGETWNTATVSPNFTRQHNFIRFLNGMFLSGDLFGGVYHSSNGKIWNYEGVVTSGQVSDATYGSAGFMLVAGVEAPAVLGGTRITLVGAPGAWIVHDSGTPGHISKLAYFVGKYVGMLYDGGLVQWNPITGGWNNIDGQPVGIIGTLGVFQGKLYASGQDAHGNGFITRTADLVTWESYGNTFVAPFAALCAGEVPLA